MGCYGDLFCFVATWSQAAQASLKLVKADTEFLNLSLWLFICELLFLFLGFVCLFCFFFFRTGPRCVAPADLELTTQTKLALRSQGSTCLCLLC